MRFITVVTHVIAVLVGVGAGVAIAAIRHADAGNLLSFAGSLIGAAVAVMGGAVLLRFEESAKGRDRYRLMIEALDEAIGQANAMIAHVDDVRTGRTRERSLTAHASSFTHAMVRLQAITKTMPDNDLRLMKARGELSQFGTAEDIRNTAKTADIYKSETPPDFRQLFAPVLVKLRSARDILLRN